MFRVWIGYTPTPAPEKKDTMSIFTFLNIGEGEAASLLKVSTREVRNAAEELGYDTLDGLPRSLLPELREIIMRRRGITTGEMT